MKRSAGWNTMDNLKEFDLLRPSASWVSNNLRTTMQEIARAGAGRPPRRKRGGAPVPAGACWLNGLGGCMMYGMNRTLSLPLLLVTFVTVAFLATTAASAATKPVTVDYVIGLLDAGVDQADIVARIQERDLTFRFAPGDIDRLRAAGASEDLIDEVLG